MSAKCGCGKSTSGLECGLCKAALCKSCTVFLDADYFSFLPKVPQELTHCAYCNDCFTAQIQAQVDEYDQKLERAKNILVYEKKQSKETRLFKRLEEPVNVTNCSDRQETLLRLGFLAAELNYNAIIDVHIEAKKISNGSYQTTVFSGSGIPTKVDTSKIIRDRSHWQNPN